MLSAVSPMRVLNYPECKGALWEQQRGGRIAFGAMSDRLILTSNSSRNFPNAK
jgi:hypothetical protein